MDKEILGCKLRRDQFLEVLGGHRMPELYGISLDPIDRPSWGEAIAIWDRVPKGRLDLPTVIVVADAELDDAIGWVSTFVSGMRPFTAICRVIPYSLADILRFSVPEQQLTAANSQLLGMAIAEAWLHAARRGTFPRTVEDIFRTGSWAFSRLELLKLGGYQGGAGVLRSRLDLTSALAGAEGALPWLPETDFIFASVSSAAPANQSLALLGSHVRAAARVVGSRRVIDANTLVELIGSIILLSTPDVGALARGREERVAAFKRIAADLRSGPEADWALGFLAANLSPGSGEYFPLLARVCASRPAAVLWAGYYAGASSSPAILWENNGLGLRALRDLSRAIDPLGRPTCDISLDEAVALARVDGQTWQERLHRSGRFVRVEVMPGVDIDFLPAERPAAQQSLFGDARPTSDASMKDVQQSARSARAAVDAAARSLDEIISGVQKGTASGTRNKRKGNK